MVENQEERDGNEAKLAYMVVRRQNDGNIDNLLAEKGLKTPPSR